MRVVIQRVLRAEVRSNGYGSNRIGKGLLILLGIEDTDNEADIAWLVGKISRLRIFSDADGVMNLSVMDVNGGIMIISQFTLHASTRKGNRPSYIRAARPETAIPLYEIFVEQVKQATGLEVQTGWFGAMMQIELINDGPVTIIIDSKDKE
ncbi:D-aminoacyl-tRNA deacylase [Lentimicrobium sp.]|uniref:D-aminoacyl-tRNA deacylase n=1 Tax=Lentimicrobium sp. TaxID=2034841 RepID=UPI002D125A71|nr:D-aminoacyl-tRNA deacylase [Lentimicrobium sp.]HPF64061.1 D-aminoacyl-tRNA deacylase [Lentimicrobium sp.]HRW68671.1 D-aminoacyl-tRNA deacylase [Lentimicrobium sp.]